MYNPSRKVVAVESFCHKDVINACRENISKRGATTFKIFNYLPLVCSLILQLHTLVTLFILFTRLVCN